MSGAHDGLQIVDLATPGEWPELTGYTGCLIAVTDGRTPLSDAMLRRADHATMTLTAVPEDDRRFITVDSVADTITALTARIADNVIAATICDDVLRANAAHSDTVAAVTTESLAYSTLQAGTGFHDWLAAQGPRRVAAPADPVLIDRIDGTLIITLNQPERHNAFSNALRAGLIDALTVAAVDSTITTIELRGSGRSFCSGGDLDEFGTFENPAAAHLARTRYSPALLLDDLRHRLGSALTAHTHGAVMGSGLEMAAFCGQITARHDATFALPELSLGLLPGAGGTVSIPRRIGRWRTAYLVLSGTTINASTALGWGLIDSIDDLR